ncbi:MAG TPA: DUF1697 domain-containing protein [Steroidobacteraceae bacterium]|nr:DUF1697 domain-containing protein [Steroidobacteraceae bacterium]
MPRYVALFRGINVGKAKRIAMADLRALLDKLGYADVATLLNSGNAVFTGNAEPAATHATRIRTAVQTKLGVEACVIVKSAKDVAAIVTGNAIVGHATDHSKLLVAVTGVARDMNKVSALPKTDWGREKVHVNKHAAYVWCGNGILESRVTVALFKELGPACTTRNWATLLKIQGLMDGGR